MNWQGDLKGVRGDHSVSWHGMTLFVKTVSLCVSVHGSLAVVKIKSTTSLFYQVRNMQNYAVECTCQTKLKVCVSVFDLVSWRRGQTTVAVSAYIRTLVGTTHCPSQRATVSGKIDLLLHHEKTSKCTCTWYYQADDTCIPLPRKSLWTPQKIVDCKVGLCTSLQTVAELLQQYSA